MYLDFFKLHRKPFELAPNPEFLYLSDEHKRAIAYLEHGLTSSNGFILLTGEVGSGKTTLLHNLIQSIQRNVVFAKVFNTKIDPEHMLALINHDFGLDTEGKEKSQLIRELYDFLIGQYAMGNKAVLIIDEAQNLSGELLEEIRLLTNLETAEEKLLQVVLVGQPELRTVLAAESLRQLRQRISINCHLRPLQREDCGKYIQRRLETAGNRFALRLDEPALDLIHEITKGVPRLINILGEYMLIDSFIVKDKHVNRERVQTIVEDVQFKTFYWGDEAAPQQDAQNPEPADTPSSAGGSSQAPAKVPQVMVRILRNIDRRLQVIEGHFYQDSAAEESGSARAHASLITTIGELATRVERIEHMLSGNGKAHDVELDSDEGIPQNGGYSEDIAGESPDDQDAEIILRDEVPREYDETQPGMPEPFQG